jgi:hypothetical protein
MSFAQRGFAILPSFLAEPELTGFVDELARCLRATKLAIRRRDDVFAVRNLLEVAPVTRTLLRGVEPRRIVKEILGTDARLVRALYFDKPPASSWGVPWHQDRTIAVEERAELAEFTAWTRKVGVVHVHAPARILESMLTIRIHLDDDADNGPLRVISGSHLRGVIAAEQIADVVGGGELVTCRVPRGGALLMRPLLLHSSQAARAAVHRRVVHLELAACALPSPLRWHLEERLHEPGATAR